MDAIVKDIEKLFEGLVEKFVAECQTSGEKDNLSRLMTKEQVNQWYVKFDFAADNEIYHILQARNMTYVDLALQAGVYVNEMQVAAVKKFLARMDVLVIESDESLN